MLVSVRSFSYTPGASSNEVSFTLLMLVLVRSFSDTPDVSFSEEFLLHS